MKAADRSGIEAAIIGFLDAELALPAGTTIESTSRLREDLGLSSLDAVELLIALEDRYGMIVSDEEAVRLMTIDDVTRLVLAWTLETAEHRSSVPSADARLETAEASSR